MGVLKAVKAGVPEAPARVLCYGGGERGGAFEFKSIEPKVSEKTDYVRIYPLENHESIHLAVCH